MLAYYAIKLKNLKNTFSRIENPYSSIEDAYLTIG